MFKVCSVLQAILFAWGALCLGGCGRAGTPLVVASATNSPVLLEGFGTCSLSGARASFWVTSRPMVVLVHGSHSHGARLAPLAQALEERGVQALCYNYDYRRTLTASARGLREGLHSLEQLTEEEITVLGHSQGGLVARLALSRSSKFAILSGRYQLVTVSAPFNGIDSAEQCGIWPYHVGSFGVSMGICAAIAGANWSQIHERSKLVVQPPPLIDQVEKHVAVVTRERASCERMAPGQPGRAQCLKEDVVFSVEEQENPRLLRDDRTVYEHVVAGHTQVVGEVGEVPSQLFSGLLKHQLFLPLRD